jgi:thermitase
VSYIGNLLFRNWGDILKKLILLLSLFSIAFLWDGDVKYAQKEEVKRIVVRYKDGYKPTTQTKFQTKKGARNTEIIEVPKDKVKSVIENMKENKNVEYVEQEVQYSYLQTVNDILYPYQRTSFNSIRAEEAWDVYKPQKRPIVAIIDSGIDMNHPDLKSLIVKPYNAMSPGQPPYDDIGHGTHVAGIVSALTNNKIGVASLSKGVSIMPVKVGDQYTLSSIDIAHGIYYAVDNGANIINISIGGGYSQYIEEACNYAYEKGVLVVAAAGNESTSDPSGSYPAAHNNVLAVAAYDSSTNAIADFSNYGDWVSIAAPGVDILSTIPGGYYNLDGTSMAAPMVTSLAAMLKSQDPTLTSNQIRWMIEYSSAPYVNYNRHPNGKIDAYSALKLYEEFARIYGATSVETSNEIAKTGWKTISYKYLIPKQLKGNEHLERNEGRFAILASNKTFPDSLVAGALSYMLDAPILLTHPDYIKDSTLQTLKDLEVTDVIILGGPVAVSEKVSNALSNQGLEITRLSGADRFKTAVAISNYIAQTGGEVIVVNCRNFPDALSVSRYAALHQIPIVFVDKDQIPIDTKKFLDKYNFSKIIVVGGTTVISDKVKNSLPNAVRISGEDRYETNIEVIKYFEQNTKFSGYIFAAGSNFPDALAGGVFSAKIGYPLLLVEKDRVPYYSKTFITETINNSSENLEMIILGGKVAISPSTVWLLDKIIYNKFYTEQYSSNTKYSSVKKLETNKVH